MMTIFRDTCYGKGTPILVVSEAPTPLRKNVFAEYTLKKRICEMTVPMA